MADWIPTAPLASCLVELLKDNAVVPELGWDDSLYHDMWFDLYDGIVFFLLDLEKRCGVDIEELRGDPYIPSKFFLLFETTPHAEIMRLPVMHLARVVTDGRWSPTGMTEREQAVDRTIVMLRTFLAKDAIKLRAPLYHKLGLYGDQADGFFGHFATVFNVNLDGFTRRRFFPDKKPWRQPRRGRTTIPQFLVRDLIPIVLEGKWSEPGTRDDLLIAWRP